MRVSVCVVTYNHERYIERCVRSLLDQQAGFDFEVIVADDASTDRAPEILARLAQEDARLRVIRREVNRGPSQNLLDVHHEARGELVCHMDGDDYAAPGKLAAQEAVLAASPGLAACGHRMAFVDSSGAPNGFSYPARLGEVVTQRQVVRWGMPFLASSLMYRRGALTLHTAKGEFLDWFYVTDILRAGPAGYVDQALGFYTVNPASTTDTLRRVKMRELMLSLYAERLCLQPGLRPDVFCYAAVAALSCLKQGDRLTPAHRALLARSFTPAALFKVPDAVAWALSNMAALAR